MTFTLNTVILNSKPKAMNTLDLKLGTAGPERPAKFIGCPGDSPRISVKQRRQRALKM